MWAGRASWSSWPTPTTPTTDPPPARNAMAFPHLARAGRAPHQVARLMLFWTEEPNAWVDVSATVGRKVAALREHRSQVREPEKLEERVLGWARARAPACPPPRPYG